MDTRNDREQGGASQEGRKKSRRGKTESIGQVIRGVFDSVPGGAGAGPARTGKGAKRRGVRGRLLPAVLCHPRLGWRDMIGLAVIYALPASGPDAGWRGGLKRLCDQLHVPRRRWRQRLKRYKRMRLLWRKRVRGERAAQIVRAEAVPRTFWRAAGAKCRRRGLGRNKGKGGQRAGGLAALGYYDLPPGLLSEHRLSLAARAVWAWLLYVQSWGSERRAFPSTRTIARQLKMGHDTVWGSLAELRVAGVIVETGRKARRTRIWAVRRAIGQGGHSGTVGGTFRYSKGDNQVRINSILYRQTSIASDPTQKPPPMLSAKSAPGDQSGPAESPQARTADADNIDRPVNINLERQRQLANVRGVDAIAARHGQPASGQPAASTWAEEIRQIGVRVNDPGSAVAALVTVKMNPRRAREAVEVFKVPMVRGTLLLLADRIQAGQRIRNLPGWITRALREGWARPAVAAVAGKAARADAVNAPAEIVIEWTPEARAALKDGHVRECTEQEAIERAIACLWPHIAWPAWANIITHSDPMTAAALRSYLLATHRDVPAWVTA